MDDLRFERDRTNNQDDQENGSPAGRRNAVNEQTEIISRVPNGYMSFGKLAHPSDAIPNDGP